MGTIILGHSPHTGDLATAHRGGVAGVGNKHYLIGLGIEGTQPGIDLVIEHVIVVVAGELTGAGAITDPGLILAVGFVEEKNQTDVTPDKLCGWDTYNQFPN